LWKVGEILNHDDSQRWLDVAGVSIARRAETIELSMTSASLSEQAAQGSHGKQYYVNNT
jgi:hypothetical protein